MSGGAAPDALGGDPAEAAFAAYAAEPRVFGQVQITPVTHGWELRHVADAATAEERLTDVLLNGLAEWVKWDARAAYRPNKAAPNLRAGWTARAESPRQLFEAVQRLYPGAVADWYAESAGAAPTDLAALLARQTGMYRPLRALTVAEASRVAEAGCAPAFCLRRRLWGDTAASAGELPGSRSVIPCFEPCGVVMELMRRSAKAAQAEAVCVPLSPDEVATVVAALERASALGAAEGSEGDLSQPSNPRRARLALARLQACQGAGAGPAGDEE